MGLEDLYQLSSIGFILGLVMHTIGWLPRVIFNGLSSWSEGRI